MGLPDCGTCSDDCIETKINCGIKIGKPTTSHRIHTIEDLVDKTHMFCKAVAIHSRDVKKVVTYDHDISCVSLFYVVT